MIYELNDNMSIQFSPDTKKHVHGSFTVKFTKGENGTFIASINQEPSVRHTDDVGALYYVVAVIFIYGCSILMMIASYIRKNDNDRRLSRYLKEMASVRKRETQMQLLSATAKAAHLSKKRGTEASLKPYHSSLRKPRLSSVSEASVREFNGSSDVEKDWETKSQYHLLTPTPSPGVTPGNSPSSISNSPVFTEFPKKIETRKKQMPAVRWVCETETEVDTDSECEQKLLLNKGHHRLKEKVKYQDRKTTVEGPSVIITPSNSPQLSRVCRGSMFINSTEVCPSDVSMSSREEESFEPVQTRTSRDRQQVRVYNRLEVQNLIQSEKCKISTV